MTAAPESPTDALSEPAGLPPERDRRDEAARDRSQLAVAVLGGALALYGLRRQSFSGTVLAVAGGWLCYRSLGGREGLSRVATIRASEAGAPAGAPSVERSVTVRADEDVLRDLWRDPDRLNRIVGPFADVSAASEADSGPNGAEPEGDAGESRLRWRFEAPFGRTLTWETAVRDEADGIRFESVEGSPVRTDWEVGFRPAPADRGTEMTLRVRLGAPGGRIGATALGLALPATLSSEALRRARSLAETGEVPTLEKNPSARGGGDLV